MMGNKKVNYFEIAIYVFISLIAICVPLFMRSDDGWEWELITREWLRLLPFFILFLVNNFLLAPKFLLKGRFSVYIISCIIMLLSVGILNNYLSDSRMKPPAHKKEVRISESDNPPPPFRENDDKLKQRPHKPPKVIFNVGALIIGVLIIGFNSGIKIFVHWIDEREEQTEKEKQYLNSELAFLKYQISPHFFMNTLNNIHALVDIDVDEAKNAIIKLSHLMRYLLYESDVEKVALTKEIEFIQSYIQLMRLRYDENNLLVEFNYPDLTHLVYIPSLLFLPLIENAFKHGVDSKEKSFVSINMDVLDKTLIFSIKNSNFPKNSHSYNEASGIGLENTQKRLNLLYSNDYKINIDANDTVFEVNIVIPLI